MFTEACKKTCNCEQRCSKACRRRWGGPPFRIPQNMAFQFGPCAHSSHNQRADSGHLGSKGGFAGARMAGFRADFSFVRRAHNTLQAFCEKHRIKSWSCCHCGSLWLDNGEFWLIEVHPPSPHIGKCLIFSSQGYVVNKLLGLRWGSWAK